MAINVDLGNIEIDFAGIGPFAGATLTALIEADATSGKFFKASLKNGEDVVATREISDIESVKVQKALSLAHQARMQLF